MNTIRHYGMLLGLVCASLMSPVLGQDSNPDGSGVRVPSATDAQETDVTGQSEPVETTSASVASSVEETPVGSIAVESATETEKEESAADGAGNAVYLEALSKEAKAGEGKAPSTATYQSSGAARISRIRSIVSEALIAPSDPGTRTLPYPEKPVEDPSPRHRREKLRKAVASANEATDTSGNRYISTIQEEGDRTFVIDAEISKRPAIALSPQTPVESTAVAVAPVGGERTYRVRSGDSLWLIAKRFYGDGYRYPVLYLANRDRVTDEDLLVVGQVLRIP